jgi:amino acid transporter
MPTPAPRRGLRLLPLIALVYCLSAGGSFGPEEVVSASGPGLAIILLVLMPIFYGLPLGLASGEMASRFPVEGGYYRWVRRLFGDFWGFQAGWCAWVGAFCDGAIYVVFAAEYFEAFLVALLPGPWIPASRQAFILLAIVACTWANVRGIHLVGWSTFVLILFIVSPFVVMCLLGAFEWSHNPLVPLKPPDKGWFESLGVGALVAMWCYSGYESLSTAAEELDDPRRNFIRAILFSICVTVPIYLIPLVTALAVTPDWASFAAGSYTGVGLLIGGPLLAAWITAAGVLGQVNLFNAYTLSYSRIPFTMAQDGFMPAFLARTHPVHGTPWASILVGAVIYGILTLLPIQTLVVIEMWLFSFIYIMVYLALWTLRRRPEIDPLPADGAFRFIIPGGKRGIWWVIGPPMALIVVAMFGSGPEYIYWGGPALLSGFLIYPLVARARRRRAACATATS